MSKSITIEQIASTAAFQGLTLEQVKEMLSRTGVIVKHFHKGDYVYLSGDIIENLCLVFHGQVQIIREDAWGEKSIVDSVMNGECFGENGFGTRVPSVLNYYVTKDCDIFMLPFNRMTLSVIQDAGIYSRFFSNFAAILAATSSRLIDKVDILGKKTLRGKIMTYLEQQALSHGSEVVQIPFSRTDLASYLDADRSAMTRELGRMAQEGIVSFQKNTFTIPKQRKV